MNKIEAIFNQYSHDYDADFSHSILGKYYRERTQQVFRRYCSGNRHTLELNSGTGEDAVHLANIGNKVLATDISSSMLRVAENKVKQHQLENRIDLKQLNINDINELEAGTFDTIISNFGGLNCINDWKGFAENAHKLLNREGLLIVCLMGPTVPWEWIWFSLKGEFTKAFRRVKGRCCWRGAEIYYPKIQKLESIMYGESFRLLHREGLGVLMPPPYANYHVKNWLKIYAGLAKMEEAICRSRLACYFADHYLLVFQRQSSEEKKYAS